MLVLSVITETCDGLWLGLPTAGAGQKCNRLHEQRFKPMPTCLLPLFSSAVSVGQNFIDHHSVECSPLAEWVIEDEGYNGTVVNAHELPQLALQPVW